MNIRDAKEEIITRSWHIQLKIHGADMQSLPVTNVRFS